MDRNQLSRAVGIGLLIYAGYKLFKSNGNPAKAIKSVKDDVIETVTHPLKTVEKAIETAVAETEKIIAPVTEPVKKVVHKASESVREAMTKKDHDKHFKSKRHL